MSPQVSAIEAAYFAGFFDGEGTVDIRYRKTHGGKYERFELRVSCYQIKIAPLERMKELFGGSLTLAHVSRWTVTTTTAGDFLRAVHPHLLVKKRQVEIALEFLETIRPAPVIHNSGFGMASIEPWVRAKRAALFQAMRASRDEDGLKPKHRNPVRTAQAIHGASYKDPAVCSDRSPSQSGENCGVP